MPLPQVKPGEFTYADYLRWPEGERWQLMDGHAYAMAPPSLGHQRTVSELQRQLGNALRGKQCLALVAPVGVRLPRAGQDDARVDTVFEPDLLVVCDPAKLDRRGVRGAPDFIIEVLSPSTAGFDLIEKRKRYDEAGVRELWLLDPASGVLTIYRARSSGGFAEPEIRRAEGVVALQALSGVSLELDFMLELREQDEPF